jgi:hypothetical protein
MMEEIDIFSQDTATNSLEEHPNNASTSSDTTTPATATTPVAFATTASSSNSEEPYRLPRTGGSSRGAFLRDTLTSQLPTSEQLQKTKQQAGRLRDSIQSQMATNDQLQKTKEQAGRLRDTIASSEQLQKTKEQAGRLRDTIQSSEQLQKTKQQAGRVFKSFGNRLSKLNLGKFIDNMEQDQGLADSLEQFNSRMKEEAERQEIRRESQELTLKVIIDHLNNFLLENSMGTYEEWIQDFHPENANQGQLLSDIQQIDERFYVMESDHRRLWNEAIEKQENEKDGDTTNDKTSYAHRLVEARTQIWGKAPGVTGNAPSQNSEGGYTDLLSDSNALQPNAQNAPANAITTPDARLDNDNGIEEIDFFAPTGNSATINNITASGNECLETPVQDDSKKEPFQDLIQF